MDSKLPTYEIKGIPFQVDVDYDLLRHSNDHRNIIEFSDLVDKGTHYELRFDPIAETADIYGDGGKGLEKVKVPPMVQLDPERVARKYNLKVSDLPRRDSELRTDPEWFRQRKMGRQPTIRIYGHTYFVNLNFGILEPKNLLADQIRLRELQRDPTNTFYFAMFDTQKQAVIPFDDKIKSIPKNAVMIKIPHERILDPFVRLRNMGWEDFPERLGKFPVRYDMEAMVLEWSDTPVPELIKKNRIHQQGQKASLKSLGKNLNR